MKRDTIQRVAAPTAILVAIPEPLATVCTESLQDGGLKVLKAGHVAAACERLPVIMPQLVVTLDDLRPEELEMLKDRCVAVGAETMAVSLKQDPRALTVQLKDAANMALIRALRRGG